ncbi:MAG: DNA primase [Actinobacteria bacterium]|nr:DNA primase [Actinomycetota bacterium]
MPGRIRDEDIALVREKSPIADVIGEHVQLRNAGGGNLKGICPFHDEKSPSLSVSPARGLFHCFGCGAGGDVIRFVERIEHLDFAESVERLADRAGVQLRYVEGGSAPARPQGQRSRLIEAHRAAQEFYAEQLRTPAAATAREFLTGRGFDEQAALRFGCGYAPDGWDALTKHLLGRKFTPSELTTAGLARETQRGSLVDRFHRRLLWPIRDLGGDVVGFGARRLYDDDQIEAKYLNTPETPIYKKSQLLYGVDQAKKEIARQHRAVVVEGYTDVMACHLAGVTTAIATCGTAFGTDHVGIIRRLLMDDGVTPSEVIFTFDGDSAGKRAAERAFANDDKFLGQTYVAVEPSGLDPCDLRQKAGDEAVRDLVARRRPLLDFVLESMADRLGLGPTPGQNDQLQIARQASFLNEAIPLLARLRDRSAMLRYAQRVASYAGDTNPDEIGRRTMAFQRGDKRAAEVAPSPRAPVDERVAADEREVLKVALQLPAVAGPAFDALPSDAFLVPDHRRLHVAIAAAGGTASAVAGPQWTEAVEAQLPDTARVIVPELAVEPLRSGPQSEERYADAMLARLQELVASRQVATLKARVQRMNPLEQPEEHARLFGELIALESHRRVLRERAIGGE